MLVERPEQARPERKTTTGAKALAILNDYAALKGPLFHRGATFQDGRATFQDSRAMSQDSCATFDGRSTPRPRDESEQRSPLQEGSLFQFFERLLELLLRVHHDGTIPCYRLFERFSGD